MNSASNHLQHCQPSHHPHQHSQKSLQLRFFSLLFLQIYPRERAPWTLHCAFALLCAFETVYGVTATSAFQLAKMSPFMNHPHELNVSTLERMVSLLSIIKGSALTRTFGGRVLSMRRLRDMTKS